MPNEEETVKGSELFLPDYIQSFTEIVKSCGHTAAYCYGIIYFFGRMAGKKCTLSNEDLASLMKVKVGTAKDWLAELEDSGFIFRVMKHGRRIEIRPIFYPSRQDHSSTNEEDQRGGKIPTPGRENPAPLHTQEENQTRVCAISPKGSTTHLFSDERISKEKERLVTDFSLSESDAGKVVLAFTDYWTAVNEGGRKQHWQKQKTFDLKLRLNAWVRSDLEKGKFKPRQKAKPVEVRPGMPAVVGGIFQNLPEGWIYDQMTGRFWENDGQLADFKSAKRKINREILPSEANVSWANL